MDENPNITPRDILAIIIVGGFVLFIGMIVVIPLFRDTPIDNSSLLQTISAIFSGTIGIIIGWYFSESRLKIKATAQNTTDAAKSSSTSSETTPE